VQCTGGHDVVANLACDCSNGFNSSDNANAINGSSST
jgi:hypothetical protein